MNSILGFFPSFCIPIVRTFGNLIFLLKPEYYEEVEGIAEAVEMDRGLMMFL